MYRVLLGFFRLFQVFSRFRVEDIVIKTIRRPSEPLRKKHQIMRIFQYPPFLHGLKSPIFVLPDY